MTEEQKNEICIKAITRYGKENQLNQTSEEVGELLQAINKWRRKPSPQNLENLAEEIADVIIMCNQLKTIVGESKVREHVEQKLIRLNDKLNS